jgi:hypothetical protein
MSKFKRLKVPLEHRKEEYGNRKKHKNIVRSKTVEILMEWLFGQVMGKS